MTHSNHMGTIQILQTAEISRRKIVFLVRAGKDRVCAKFEIFCTMSS